MTTPGRPWRAGSTSCSRAPAPPSCNCTRARCGGSSVGAFPYPFWLLAGLGLLVSPRRARIWALAVFVAAVLPAIAFSTRFHLPRLAYFAYPALYLLAGAGIAACGAWIGGGSRSRRLALCATMRPPARRAEPARPGGLAGPQRRLPLRQGERLVTGAGQNGVAGANGLGGGGTSSAPHRLGDAWPSPSRSAWPARLRRPCGPVSSSGSSFSAGAVALAALAGARAQVLTAVAMLLLVLVQRTVERPVPEPPSPQWTRPLLQPGHLVRHEIAPPRRQRRLG